MPPSHIKGRREQPVHCEGTHLDLHNKASQTTLLPLLVRHLLLIHLPCREAEAPIPLLSLWASLVAQLVKNPPAVQETWVQSLGWEDPLEKGKATHSSFLACRIPWTV